MMKFKSFGMMKTFGALMFMLQFSIAAEGQPVVSIKKQRITAAELIKEIKKQTGYNVLYSNQVMQGDKQLSVDFKHESLEKVLKFVGKQLGVSYEVENRTIMLVGDKKPAANTAKANETTAKSTAQQSLSGTVKDSIGRALQGASVAVQGSSVATSTNSDGKFSLNDVKEGDKLLVRYIGYLSQTITVTNLTSPINVTLIAEKNNIGEVVVTALGIKRDTKSLTYNVQEVKGEEITKNKDANFVNALSGKIAGVTINPSSSGIGGATRVIMRGVKSISGNNNVLYVVDGIPIPNSNGGDASGPFAGAVSGEGISSINPDDIESISALTGPSATALYGSQGANGVIVVNTKKGTIGKIRINLSHSSDFFRPFVMPRFQNTYGRNDGQMTSWGAKLKSPSSYKPEDFFQLGTNIFNSVSLSGGTEKSQTFFSLGANNANGIIRKNDYNRYNFTLRHTANLTEKFTLDFGAMYVKSNDKNMIAQGQYHNPLIPIYLFPPGDDIEKYQVYSRYDPDRKISTQFWPYGNQGLAIQNPYWVTDAQSRVNKIDRYMLNASGKYAFTDWLDLVGRARIDNSTTWSEEKRPAGTDGLFASQFGYYTSGKLVSKNTYIDLIATVRKDINEDIGFIGNLGGSYQYDHSDGISGGGKLTQLANFYSLQENTENPPSQSYNRTNLQSAFATVDFDYKKMLFLAATGRNEWSSRLSMANVKSYFYPSIGISGIVSDIFNIPQNVMSFAKVRFSYAEVGNAPNMQEPTFSIINPLANRPAPFPDFQVERTKSFETGVELKFFKNKLSVNATAYKSNTTNQLLSQPTLGIYNIFYFNAGDIENKGIEGSLGYSDNIGEFGWTTNAIFTLNRNKIKRLSEGYVNRLTGEVFGQDDLIMGSMGDLQNILQVGGTTQDLYVSQALREDNQGFLWVDPANSNIEKMTIPQRYIGRTTPDYTIGWRNNFTYKNFSLSFLLDARVGGVGVSYTQSIMDAFGVSEKSAMDRDNGGVHIYGKEYSDVQKFYNLIGGASGGSVGLSGHYVYSATNVRVREASFGYTFPESIFNNKISDLKLSVTGRNLFMFYNKSPFDPESTSSTATYGQGIDYFRQPSYRSVGFSLSARF